MKKNLLILLTAILMLLPAPAPTPARPAAARYDVVVAGAGAGGTAAAIQAARMGARVLVIEESSWIGGQMTAAGVTTMDDTSGQRSGIYQEFIVAVERYYRERGKSPNLGYYGNRTTSFEPRAGQAVLYELIDGVRNSGGTLDLWLRTRIDAVERRGATVTGVRAGSADVSCKVLIDATEHGDMIPLAGVPYRAGNSVTPGINGEAMIQDITWTAVIKRYPGGVPEHLKAKSFLTNYREEHKRNYSRFLTADGGRNPWNMPQDLTAHNAYRAMPDSSAPGFYDGSRANWGRITKTSVNFGNDYPGRIGWDKGRSGLPVRYLSDAELRRTVNRRALVKTLNFIYYLQHETGGAGAGWSVADDEFYSDEALDLVRDIVPAEWHEIVRRMPVIPYVRESRRILGETTLTSQMLLKNSLSYRDGATSAEFPDAIAIGRYNIDLHNAGEPADIEGSLGETVDSLVRNRPRGNFQVPLSVLIPAGVDGFLAAEKNLSMSRLAAGALRLQPICMMTGQAAGALAAVSAAEGVPPRSVPAIKVQWALLTGAHPVALSLANFRDVPAGRKGAAVQIAMLYGLMEPLSHPHNPSFRRSGDDGELLEIPLVKGPVLGTFGLDRRLSEPDRERLSEVPGLGPPENLPPMTRGEALEILVPEFIRNAANNNR